LRKGAFTAILDQRAMDGEGSRRRLPGEGEEQRLEHAMAWLAMPWLAGGLAHAIRNPLNALILQITLLGEKLAEAGEAGQAATAGPLASMRQQIGRIDESMRRFLQLAEPQVHLGGADLGALVADLAELLAHEARRRRIDLECQAEPEAVRARCDAARLARLLSGLFRRALGETPAGGRLGVAVAAEGGMATVRFERSAGPASPELAFITEAVAAAASAMGGRLTVESNESGTRCQLWLPGSAAQ
jgi:signal transduction histidine kinase